MPKYIDIGANLTDKTFRTNIEFVLKESLLTCVDQIILTGTNECSSIDAINMCRKYTGSEYPKLWCTVGCHPHNAKLWNLCLKNKFERLIQDNRDIVVAVGETGLDYNRMFSPIENQRNSFIDQIEISKKFGLPLFLHERDAHYDFLSIINKTNIKGVIHCFTGTVDEIRKYLELGLSIGLTGFITDDKRNRVTLSAILEIPENKLMLETDCPYMTPKNVSLTRINYPKYLPYIVNYLSTVYQQSENEISDLCYNNTIEFFNLKRPPSEKIIG